MLDRQKYIVDFKKSKGRSPTVIELATGLKISERTAIHELAQFARGKKEESVQVVKEKHAKSVVIHILIILLVLLSIMAFILSVYFTGSWFMGKFNIFISGLISLTMVLFMVVSPQVSRFIKSIPLKAILWVSFSIALLFSMGSTVAGQYQAFTAKEVNSVDLSSEFEQLAVMEQETIDLIQEAKDQRKIHEATIVLLSGTKEDRLENWEPIATERRQIDKYNEKIDPWTEKLEGIRQGKKDNGFIEEERDFYLFVSQITGKDKTLIEFTVSSLPAVFIDIVSALCLNLALLLGDLYVRKP